MGGDCAGQERRIGFLIVRKIVSVDVSLLSFYLIENNFRCYSILVLEMLFPIIAQTYSSFFSVISFLFIIYSRNFLAHQHKACGWRYWSWLFLIINCSEIVARRIVKPQFGPTSEKYEYIKLKIIPGWCDGHHHITPIFDLPSRPLRRPASSLAVANPLHCFAS